ncbi:MAG: alkaline phosphatase family protein, partial [Polyangiales bacterium]
NYIALTSGDSQGIACDGKADPTAGACNALNCSLLVGSCAVNKNVPNLGDQIETAGLNWLALGEGMGTPCNIVDAGKYAVRHVPFLYYDSIRTNASRCSAHTGDFDKLVTTASAPALQFIAPNLDHDMHDPVSVIGAPSATNFANGDAFLGPFVNSIVTGDAYKNGGLLVVVWDEDDDSGGITATDDAVPIFVASPYARAAGYMSSVTADHYSLLATIEDGLGLARLAKAGGTTKPLSDYFPNH